MGLKLQRPLPPELQAEQARVEALAAHYGLDVFPVIFEVIDYAQMNEIAAYGGFPVRYPHWRFGMEYERLFKSYEYGLSKIYELVINNNPSVAYLLEGNAFVDQKLVMAHVYGHVDFFKNNFAFSATDQGRSPEGAAVRKWIDAFANHASTVQRWSDRIGQEAVETFLDQCLRLENLIDPQLPFQPEASTTGASVLEADGSASELPDEPALLRVHRDYMAPYINPEAFVDSQRRKLEEARDKQASFPEKPARDVLGFLLQHAPLERWEHDLLTVIRNEAYYFLPQMQTKIMNEGWATYWHSKLMTEHLCTGEDIFEYADRCAGVLATQPGQLNPYKLGIELFRHIEERWNKGRFGAEWEACDDLAARRQWDTQAGLGREKIFEVRRVHNDLTFIDAFLTPEFVIEQKLYAFGYNERRGRQEVQSRDFQAVKGQLLDSLTNCGQPRIDILDANHGNRGELLLEHAHCGPDLRLDWAREVMEALERIWKRPVQLHTRVEDKDYVLRYDGANHVQTSRDAA